MHYMRWRKHGDPLWTPPVARQSAQCAFPGCPKIVGPKGARGWCTEHYRRWSYWGTPYPPPKQLSMYQTCTKCGESKLVTEFSTDNRRPEGRQSSCLKCQRQWPLRNPERVREYRRTRSDSQQRRIRAAGVPTESISRLIVAERDEWTCGFCGGTVDQDLRWPDPMSWSIDHVVPIAHGGAHLYSNVRLAHVRCNVREGGRIKSARPFQSSNPICLPSTPRL